MERKRELKLFEITLTCEQCRDGEMEYIKGTEGTLSRPVRYQHVCTRCNHTMEIASKQYPIIKMEAVERTLVGI